MTTDAFPTPKDIERAFALAYYLHLDEESVWEITLDACEHGLLELRQE